MGSKKHKAYLAIKEYIPLLEILTDLWKAGRKVLRGLTDEGMYEVLNFETTLELKDREGKRACFHKYEKVRYLQNNIIAFQDQAWGDGEILIDYQCTPGKPVDFHRPGRTTYILISLREVKNRGDIDEFHIKWGVRKGFLRAKEQWETEIFHRTKRMRLQIIFPKLRPPLRAWLVEDTRRRSRDLGLENQKQLPDGRWLLSWETQKPRLHERYILKWEW